MSLGQKFPRFALVLLYIFFTQLAIAQVAVTTYHNDNARTGANLSESTLTPSNVNAATFGKLFSFTLPDDSYPYAQPLYMPNVSIGGQVHNVLYVMTEHDVVYAFDADGKNSTPLWQRNILDFSPSGATPVPASEVSGDYMAPELGIASTPVIDRSNGTLYLVANTKENGEYVQRLHALDIATGQEKIVIGNFGVKISGAVAGTGDGGSTVTFNAATQNQRPALLLSSGTVYIAWGSYADNGLYHGWVMAYAANTLNQVGVFCTTPNGDSGSTWMLGALAADSNGNIFTTAGNGTVSNPDGGKDFGESFIRLTPGLSQTDFFTPFNWSDLNGLDTDVGSGAPLLLPDQSGAPQHLLVSAGKEGKIYLLNRDNLGGFNSTADQVWQEFSASLPNACIDGECFFGTPAYWQNKIYLHATNNPLQAYQLTNGRLSTSPVATATPVFQGKGATPVVSSNGDQNGIVWEVRADDVSSGGGPAILYAYDAGTLSKLYDSTQNANDSLGQGQSFMVPTIANGKVYVVARSQVSVYGLVSNNQLTVQLSASPTTITAGQSSTLTWSSTNATSVTISGVGTFGASGTTTVTPSSTTTYTATATGSGGSATAPATVTVQSSQGCTPAPQSVTVCSPTPGTTATSPVQFLAAANAGSGIDAMAIYVDYQLAYGPVNGSSINTSLSLATGSHNVTVQAWVTAATETVMKNSFTLTVK